ncbi:hypothetical protein ACFS6H_10895 [Terrimonas rubra]|uniref:DUF4468 domain-containing protein n=1 Tax=Terrimonas rubra TaxID=1035890 RepID=A0ABW6A4G1_9BACT
MKRMMITCLMLLSLYQLKAQETFGKASFTVPAGWQMTKNTETVTLEKALKKGVVCKIIISATEKGAVNTDADYLAYRTKNGGKGISYSNQKGAVIKYEADGLISFFSKGTTIQKMDKIHSYFYSLSNGSQTLYYQLLTNNNDCISEFNQFMETLTMELDNAGSANARARKASAAAPAAPAPMM